MIRRLMSLFKRSGKKPNLALDVSLEKARALHRVWRALNDGDCPKCHAFSAAHHVVRIGEYIQCKECRFTIDRSEIEEIERMFAPAMDAAVAIFEEWRSERGYYPRFLVVFDSWPGSHNSSTTVPNDAILGYWHFEYTQWFSGKDRAVQTTVLVDAKTEGEAYAAVKKDWPDAVGLRCYRHESNWIPRDKEFPDWAKMRVDTETGKRIM